MPIPPQVTGGHSGCHGPRGCLVSDHQCESAQSGGEPIPPEPQRKADRVGEARTAAGGRGPLQGATGPRSPSTEEMGRTLTLAPRGVLHPGEGGACPPVSDPLPWLLLALTVLPALGKTEVQD